MLYVPILKLPIYQYTKVYPLPNSQNVVLIPPTQYHLQGIQEELWTEESCRTMDALKNPRKRNATSNECTYAEVINNYKLYVQFKNNKIIVSTKNTLEIIEKCPSKISRQSVKYNAAVSSQNN